MNLKKIFTLGFLLCNSIFSQENHTDVWFSERKEFRNGFEFLQLAKQNTKFTFAKLSYNENKKWEETRVHGFIEEIGNGKYKLKPEMCTVYAIKKLGLRWILIQGFDCDHFEMQMTVNEQLTTISPSIGISEKLSLITEQNKFTHAIVGIVIKENEQEFQVWSLAMRYVKKGALASIKQKPITILETVDSTGTFTSKEKVQVGDIVTIKNVESKLFD